MANVTYIIPIHKFDKTVQTLLPKALLSIKNSEDKEYSVILVGPKEILAQTEALVKEAKLSTVTKYVENENTDVFVQINTAVMRCTSPYFCVVEYDDEVAPFWGKRAKEYGENNASVLLPLIEFYSAGVPVSFGNELAWDTAFADEHNLGYIDAEQLNTYMDFLVSGALIKTEDYIAIGGVKPSLKIAAWYEFLLRCCHKHKDIYVVPKLGYKHAIDTPDSYSEITHKEISKDEGTWLITTAKQEYFFKEDRNKKFGEE